MSTEYQKDIRKVIKEFILQSIHLADLRDDDNLFESGLVNSLFAVQLITFLEKTFHIEVTMDDLDMENFKSVQAAATFIEKRRGSPVA